MNFDRYYFSNFFEFWIFAQKLQPTSADCKVLSLLSVTHSDFNLFFMVFIIYLLQQSRCRCHFCCDNIFR